MMTDMPLSYKLWRLCRRAQTVLDSRRDSDGSVDAKCLQKMKISYLEFQCHLCRRVPSLTNYLRLSNRSFPYIVNTKFIIFVQAIGRIRYQILLAKRNITILPSFPILIDIAPCIIRIIIERGTKTTINARNTGHSFRRILIKKLQWLCLRKTHRVSWVNEKYKHIINLMLCMYEFFYMSRKVN